MALLRKLFFRKPPDGLLEICERVYGTVFPSSFVLFGLILIQFGPLLLRPDWDGNSHFRLFRCAKMGFMVYQLFFCLFYGVNLDTGREL